MNAEFDTITDVSRKIRNGITTSAALTELMLDRISRYNGQLNAYITVTAELARNQARQADEELKSGLPVGMMITGRQFEDNKVLTIAAAMEKVLNARRTPPDF